MRTKSRFFILGSTLLLLPLTLHADEDQSGKGKDLGQADIESLMNMEVTTASKKSESLFDVAAAMTVITQDDIRRSGARTIPDLLRMVPGFEVQQLTSNRWKVSARGFEAEFANKLQVLIDGRSVYEPDFAGVYWDSQDMVLDNIERIEVIRGPGGSLWGANAVDGIINIITKSAKDTLGGFIHSGAGSLDRTVQEARYGSKFGKDGFFRVSGKYRLGAATRDTLGNDNRDAWHSTRADFRADWGDAQKGAFMVQGGTYRARLGRTSHKAVMDPPFVASVFETDTVLHSFILGRWDVAGADKSGSTLQLFYEHTDRDLFEAHPIRDTVDLDYSHRQDLGARNSLIYGLGYRQNHDDVLSKFIIYTPELRNTHLYSGFLQDELKLDQNNKLVAGIKAEHNDFTGMEIQPSLRLTHTISKDQVSWLAVSRSVRTPTQSDFDLAVDSLDFPTDMGIPGVVRLVGGHIKSEELIAYEAGFRLRKNDRFLFDASAFFNQYRNLRATLARDPFQEDLPTPHIVFPYQYVNGLSAQTAGIELDTKYQAGPSWKFDLFYRYEAPRFRFTPGSTSDFQTDIDSFSHHTAGLTAAFQPSSSLLANVQLFYYDHVRPLAPTDLVSINSNWRLDANFIWTAKPGLDFNLNFQNLLMPKRVETNFDGFTVPSSIPRSVYAGVSYKF